MENKTTFFSKLKSTFAATGRFLLNFFKKDTWLKIISLVFAIFIWAYVIADENPVRTMTLKSVPVSITGIEQMTAQGYTIDTDSIPKEVDLIIQAGQDSHRSINVNTVRAFVDLSQINSVGETELTVQTTVSISGATVQRKTPATVIVKVEKYSSKTVPVSYVMSGTASEGLHVGEPVLENDQITIKGNESSIANVTHAVVDISIDGLKENSVQAYEPRLLDKNNSEVSVNCSGKDIPSVIASIKVSAKKTVKFDLEGSIQQIMDVADGYTVKNLTPDPETFELIGNVGALSTIDSIVIYPVSLQGASSGKLITAQIKLPTGVSSLSGNEVTLYVQIEENAGDKVFENIEIKKVNLENGYDAILRDKYTDVHVTGPTTVVEALKRGDISVYVDLTGLGPGAYNLPVRIESIPGIENDMISLEITTVSVTIG